MTIDRTKLPLTSTHWGNYRVEVQEGKIVALHGFEGDPDPSPIGAGIVDAIDGPTRITAPMVRRSWLERGPGSATHLRGIDPFVEVSWDTAEQLVADELERVRTRHGNQAIYAGSYGWGNAGRFHHPQGQLKRFLNCIGGFTRSVNTYSFAAGEVIIPHVLGADLRTFAYGGPTWPAILEQTELIVAFGGIRTNNGQISQGGGARHVQRIALADAVTSGIHFVNVSPVRSDLLPSESVEWCAIRPSSDTALMLALAWVLLDEDLHDAEFLTTHTTGSEAFCDYVRGSGDDVPKTPEWASSICDVLPDQIRMLARRMATSRTLINVSWSLTRQEHGEQAYWAAVSLASMLGQIGQPGRGIAFGLSSVNTVGYNRTAIPAAALPQHDNPVEDYIPVARVSDMLCHPGEPFTYDGHDLRYPDVRLVWWAGGNPFHHHQDLGRLIVAWQRPDTVIVNEWCWTATARRADIVLPCTTNLEREDISITPSDGTVTVMTKVIEPVGRSRNDRDIFRGISRRMGVEELFTEGLSDDEWIEQLYDTTREAASRQGVTLPSLIELRERGWFEAERPKASVVQSDALTMFRADPDANPLCTPSGRIELYSETIAGFDYADCPGHATWIEPREWGASRDRYPLHVLTNQPTGKLHSHLDQGSVSQATKIEGREPVRLHTSDASVRRIEQHDVVRVFNDRGACLAVAVLTDEVRSGVVQMATGAWFDPVDQAGGDNTCKHGNPNVFTADVPTSSLAQGCTAHTCLVEIERFDGEPPAVTAFEPPEIIWLEE